MRKVIFAIITLVTSLSLPSLAQDGQFIRGNCLPDVTEDDVAAARGVRRLPTPNTLWDANRIYPVAVVLFEASDTTFTIEEPRDCYNRIFNEHEYNERNGMGCVADYFHDQSHGLLNMEFHIYGPVKVSQPMRITSSGTNYGKSSFYEAMQKVVDDNPDVDFSQYDWNGDGYVEQVAFIYAGFGGNETNDKAEGCIWPSTSTFTYVMASDVRMGNYTASPELWAANSQSCGIGTICHEFTHSLGLPDIYPTSSSAGYSVCDEWDLMDGGNFTNYGWCPPNYTPLEKMLLGWLKPIELTEKMTITDLKPVDEGGEVYQVKHSENEYLLLENRQQSGWDFGVPGRGLVIYHVQYEKSAWSGNAVNNKVDKRRFELVHADNMDYDEWKTYIKNNKLSTYADKPRLHNRYLSTSPYPFVTENEDGTPVVNDQLTDTSVPPVKMNYANDEGSLLLGKPITNITMTDDGLISFEFMGDPMSGIVDLSPFTSHLSSLYDLQGRRVNANYKGLVICNGKLKLQ